MIGVERGPTTWRTISQADIDAFAQITGDHQWIHVDVERAKRESPFGTTIAHGNLTLSCIDGLREQITARDAADLEQIALGVNMGWNRVRFPAPVPAGSNVRATAELVSVEEKTGGWWEIVDRFTIHVEGSEKPACVAESVGRILLREQ
jgi:acyl dehydratase